MADRHERPIQEPAQAPAALDDFPSAAAFEEAYRALHNVLAWLHNLLTLEQVAQTMRDARQQHDALRATITQTEAEQAEAEQSLATLREQQQALAADFSTQRAQALQAHQEYLGALQAEAVALEEPLQQQRDALRETRQQAERLKATMVTEAQRQAQAEKAQAMTELVRLRQEKAQLTADVERLTAQKSQMSADVADAIRKLGGVGV